MKELITLQFVLDLVLFFLIFGFIYKSKGKNQKKDSNIVKNDLINVTDSLVEILKESEKVSEQLATLITKGEKLEKNRNEITLLIKQSNNILPKLEKSISSSLKNSSDDDIKNNISKLRKDGYSLQEIVKKTGVPEGEVELIINLLN